MTSAPHTRRDLLALLGSAALTKAAATTAGLMSAGVALAPASAADAAPEGGVTDLVGRTVALRRPAARIVLLDARDIVTMGILDPDPARFVVGWADVDRFDSDEVRRQYGTRPGGDAIPVVGGRTGDALSVERILALEPDLVVATAHMEPELGEGALTRRLEEADVPVIFSSAVSNGQPAGDAAAGVAGDPFDAMARGLRMWGAVLGRSTEAEAFIAFVAEHLARIDERVAGLTPTKAYLEVQSTYDDCCWAAGRRIWGDLLVRAGGRLLSALDAPWYAKVGVEQMMVEAPEVYIASGGAYGAGIRPGIGPGLDPAKARAGLRRLAARRGFATVPAVRDGRVHGVWTGILTVPPLNILFLEVAAKWLHPEAFADLDPADTLGDLNRRFLARPLGVPCWLSLARTAAEERQ